MSENKTRAEISTQSADYVEKNKRHAIMIKGFSSAHGRKETTALSLILTSLHQGIVIVSSNNDQIGAVGLVVAKSFCSKISKKASKVVVT